MKNADIPAMPMFSDNAEPCIVRDPETRKKAPATGLTKREMMAMHICAGISGSIDSEDCYRRIKIMAERCGVNVSQWIARDAVKQADALLAELERTK